MQFPTTMFIQALIAVGPLEKIEPRTNGPYDILQISEDASNKAVYTTAPVAGGWAGAVMSWAGAEMIWAGA